MSYSQTLFCNLDVKKMSETPEPTNGTRTRSGRVSRRVTRYEPQEIVEDDSSCSDFSMSDDDDNSIPGSYLGDRSDVEDEAFEINSEVEDDDNSDVEEDESDVDVEDVEEEDVEDVLDWDRLTENASDEESSDEDDF